MNNFNIFRNKIRLKLKIRSILKPVSMHVCPDAITSGLKSSDRIPRGTN